VAAPATIAGEPRWRASLLPLVAPGVSWDDTRLEVAATLERRLTPRWRLGALVGYGRATHQVLGQARAFHTLPARAGVGFGSGRFELGAQAGLRAHVTDGDTTVLWGGWAEARAQLVHLGAGSLWAVLAAEVLTERLEYRAATPGEVIASEYVTPWLGVAFATP
jgi:hypothetical protein